MSLTLGQVLLIMFGAAIIWKIGKRKLIQFKNNAMPKQDSIPVQVFNYQNGLIRPVFTPQHFICQLASRSFIVSSAYPVRASEVTEFGSYQEALSHCYYKLQKPSDNATGIPESNKLRPLLLSDFIGQEKLKKRLEMSINAAKNGALLPHMLFEGNAGLGKTTLSQILANEINVKCHCITAPSVRRQQDLVKTILEIKDNDILFIDEIHRLRVDIEELLYPVMEDFKLDLAVGIGETRQIKQISLSNFTLIGATTIAGSITKPLKDRFKKTLEVEFYTPEDLAQVVRKNSIKLGLELTEKAALEVAKRARGTPRIANNLMEDVILFAKGHGLGSADDVCACAAFELSLIDELGLTRKDRHVLKCIAESPNGKPIGINALAATANEDKDTIAETIEPFLLRIGLIKRTAQGRIITEKGAAVVVQN